MIGSPGRALLVGLALVMAACGYHLSGRSSVLPLDVRSIGIPTFVNKTDRPELEQRITEEVVSQFITRGRTQIRTTEEGVDAVLRGEISRFLQVPVSINPQGRATRYEIVINARAALVRAADDKVLWQDDHFIFRAQYNVEDQGRGLTTQENVALDQVARDFAESVVTSILEGF